MRYTLTFLIFFLLSVCVNADPKIFRNSCQVPWSAEPGKELNLSPCDSNVITDEGVTNGYARKRFTYVPDDIFQPIIDSFKPLVVSTPITLILSNEDSSDTCRMLDTDNNVYTSDNWAIRISIKDVDVLGADGHSLYDVGSLVEPEKVEAHNLYDIDVWVTCLDGVVQTP